MAYKQDELHQFIKNFTGVDIFEETRKRDNVEMRSTYNYILHTVLNKGCSYIARLYQSKGKNYDHSTVIHSLKMFEVYKAYNKKIPLILAEVCRSYIPVSGKIQFIERSLRDLNEEQVDEVLDIIQNKIKQYDDENKQIFKVQAEPVEA